MKTLTCKEVKGRKNYRCDWCNGNIEKGLKHYYRAYKFEGDFITDRMHSECFWAMVKSDHRVIENGWIPGEFERGVKIGE